MNDQHATQLGQGLYFEDLTVGRKFRTIRRTITEADLCAFINVTHMNEVLFIDTTHALEESLMKGRIVPGALIYSFAEGLCLADLIQHTGMAFLQMDLQMEGPAFVGDTIYADIEVIEARVSQSRSDRGLVRTRNRVMKHDGTPVLIYTPMRMIKRRSAS